jgi:Flp pilus assembly pilin Flp
MQTPAPWSWWPLPLVAGALPLAASLMAWAVSTHAGAVPACNPFIDGCVSISRAARQDASIAWFRALLLPAATLQALVWLLQAQALRAIGGDAVRGSARALIVLGVMAGVALVTYGSFLGLDGEVYRFLRRYGTVVAFGGTCLAMLVVARALQRLQALGQADVPRGHERALVVLLVAVVLLGVGNAVVGAVAGDALADRVENVTEWWGALGLTLGFAVLASLWRRWDLRWGVERQ